MAKKYFTDESLATFVNEVKSYTDSAVSTKANSSHNHAASNITSGTLSSDRLPTVPITKGGTGATTAAEALTNLGIIATASELNKLDGVTATTAELNYVDGVTSNIQTQLDGKADNDHTHSQYLTQIPATYYTGAEVDNLLSEKAAASHTHDEYLVADDIADKIDIIDVAELPTENINPKSLYRITKDAYKVSTIDYSDPDTQLNSTYIKVIAVDSLPETGKDFDSDLVVYYNKTEDNVYVYVEQMWLTSTNAGFPYLGCVSSYEEMTSTEGLYLIHEKQYNLYEYTDGCFVKILTEGSEKPPVIFRAIENPPENSRVQCCYFNSEEIDMINNNDDAIIRLLINGLYYDFKKTMGQFSQSREAYMFQSIASAFGTLLMTLYVSPLADGVYQGKLLAQNIFHELDIKINDKNQLELSHTPDLVETIATMNLDTTPTENSQNLVLSSGVYSAIQEGKTYVDTELAKKASSTHTHSNATTSQAGFMSASDKTKLDGINTNNLVTLDGNQTITGVKTFNTINIGSNGGGIEHDGECLTISDPSYLYFLCGNGSNAIELMDDSITYTSDSHKFKGAVDFSKATISETTINHINTGYIEMNSNGGGIEYDEGINIYDSNNVCLLSNNGTNGSSIYIYPTQITYDSPSHKFKGNVDFSEATIGRLKIGSNGGDIEHDGECLTIGDPNNLYLMAFDDYGQSAIDIYTTEILYDSISHKFNGTVDFTSATVTGLPGYITTGAKSGTTIGECATAEGFLTTASGDYSHAEGLGTTALGHSSHAAGMYTIANNNQYVVGRYNKDTTAPTSVTDTATSTGLFIVGIGSSEEARSNGFRVSAGGKVYGTGVFGTSGADYAEYFEWFDGNPNNEDRRGRFVTLDGGKIRYATSNDDYILGVVSANPSVAGDIQSESWHDMYLKDIYGSKIIEVVEVEETTNENGEIIPAHTESRWILNPNYNPNAKYISREERPEWAAIGIVGKLVVVDDGTCQVNGYCYPNVDGVATASQKKAGYRVMERLDETHVRIFIK